MTDHKSQPKPLTGAEREAQKAFKDVDAVKMLSERQMQERAFFENRDRLKAERLAREAKARTLELPSCDRPANK